jgi:branched-subunit amino acid aminotransferase/4-amino-4-deoxychorismate lyase
MSAPQAYWRDDFVPLSEVLLPISDAGFVFGATVTDLCRTFRHELYRLDDHLARLQASCTLAAVPLDYSATELKAIATELAARNAQLLQRDQELILVLFATPGEVGPLADPAQGNRPSFCAYTYPLPFERYRALVRDGAKLKTPSIRQVPADVLPPQIKQRSRLHWWRAEMEAGPGRSALMLNADGFVTETSTANFLITMNGHILCPRRECVLHGVSLQVVQELCGELGICFGETDLTLADCLAAEEALVTSTPFCVAPVQQLNERQFKVPGPIYQRLVTAWSQRVGLDIRRQFVEPR